MRAREAKDFLVEQIKQQAAIENQSLSGLEVQMLYFTEGSVSEKMQALAAEFDASQDSKVYEQKIAHLMKRAYKRLKNDDPPAKETWDRAIRCLKKGDHYILVMWGENSAVTWLLVLAVLVLFSAFRFGIDWFARTATPPNPHLLLALFLTLVASVIVFQRQLGRVLDWVLDHTVERFFGSKSDEND
jgi:hypothetical protein